MEPFESIEKVEQIAASDRTPTRRDGILRMSFEALQFFRDMLAEYPPLDRAAQISMPDLQGPLDTAEQIWGSSIYYAFYDAPELLDALLRRIGEAIASHGTREYFQGDQR